MREYSEEEAKKLLKLARQSIEEEFTDKKPENLEGKKFEEKRGVFITLHKKEQLRGCIGFPYPVLPLSEAVIKAAKSAAFSDPRFMPLQKEELQDVKIEISVLSVPEECKAEDVEISRDGLMCEYRGYSGLLLPQVATEHNMDRHEFIGAVCEKAGLPRDVWKKEGFKLFKFQCQIFSEFLWCVKWS
jgi:hypothetical protein